jgi:hypothetical protein
VETALNGQNKSTVRELSLPVAALKIHSRRNSSKFSNKSTVRDRSLPAAASKIQSGNSSKWQK